MNSQQVRHIDVVDAIHTSVLNAENVCVLEYGIFPPTEFYNLYMEDNMEKEGDKVRGCDYCENLAVIKCYFCGKDLCPNCTAWVEFIDMEVVRGRTILFYYHKPMCKEHLPTRRDCE